MANSSREAAIFETAVVLLSSRNAIGLRLTGADAYRELTREGGQLAGLPAVASDAVGDRIILLDTSGVIVADDGEADAEISRSATLEMSDDPTQDGSLGTGAPLVSLWQNNLVAVKLTRFINWTTRPGAVAYLEDVNYLSAGSPV